MNKRFIEAPVIIVELRLKVAPPQKTDLIKLFESFVGKTAAKFGCNSVDLWFGVEDDCSMMYREEWDSSLNLLKHINSSEFKKIMAAMEIASEKPDLQFFPSECSMGFELVEKYCRGY